MENKHSQNHHTPPNLSKRVSNAILNELRRLQVYEKRIISSCSGCFVASQLPKYKTAFLSIHETKGIVYGSNEEAVSQHQGKIILPSDVADILFENGSDCEKGNEFEIVLTKKTQRTRRWKNIEGVRFRAVDFKQAKILVDELEKTLFLHCVVYTVGRNGQFPESLLKVPNETAVCISGGGTRSHVCAGGQLRALHHLGLLRRDKINYLSSTSGGTWATSIYNFYHPKTCGSDEELLGDLTNVSSLTLSKLAESCSPIGSGAKESIRKAVAKLFFSSTPRQEIFTQAIGNVFLERFGLNDDNPFSLSETLDIIKETNPLLRERDFHYAKPGRPFWICNASMLGPQWSDTGDIIPIQFTPFYCGSPFCHTIHYKDRNRFSVGRGLDFNIGGGMIDTFAFLGTSSIEGLPKINHLGAIDTLYQYVANKTESDSKLFLGVEKEFYYKSDDVLKRFIRVPVPSSTLSIRDTCGIVGMAYALTFRAMLLANRFVPKENYWNALTEKEESLLMQYGDGGLTDNLAILPMLQRRVKRIIVFFNGYIPLPDIEPSMEITYEVFPSTNLLPLFGVSVEGTKYGDFKHNHVFEREKLDELLYAFQDMKKRGMPAVVRQRLKVLENNWWNIRGNWEVEILWFYLEHSETFINNLPEDTKEELVKGKEGNFGNFPHYSTFN